MKLVDYLALFFFKRFAFCSVCLFVFSFILSLAFEMLFD